MRDKTQTTKSPQVYSIVFVRCGCCFLFGHGSSEVYAFAPIAHLLLLGHLLRDKLEDGFIGHFAQALHLRFEISLQVPIGTLGDEI